MKVLVVEPQKPCRVQEIESLADMQQLVGGDIEAVYPFQELVALVCNSEGKLLGLPMNRPLLDKDYLPYDIIRGTFFVAGLGQENFVSLTDEQIQRYKSLYDNMQIIPVRTATGEQGRIVGDQHIKKKGKTDHPIPSAGSPEYTSQGASPHAGFRDPGGKNAKKRVSVGVRLGRYQRQLQYLQERNQYGDDS